MKYGLKITGVNTIYRKDFDGRPAYSILVSEKREDEERDSGFMRISFRRGVELANRTKINITDGWFRVWKEKISIFANEFETIVEEEKPSGNIPAGFEVIDDDDIPF